MIDLLPDQCTIWPGGFLSYLSNPLGAQPLAFDAVIREAHSDEWALSDNALEDGTVVTDHVQPLPRSFELEAVLAQCPGRITLPEQDRARKLRERLLAIAATREPFDITHSLGFYASMVFRRIGTVRTAESGDALVCSCQLRAVWRATVDQALVLADAAIAMSLGQQNLGTLQTSPAPGAPLPVI